jgi:hypothetical protein
MGEAETRLAALQPNSGQSRHEVDRQACCDDDQAHGENRNETINRNSGAPVLRR